MKCGVAAPRNNFLGGVMIKLACNYSERLIELIDDNDVRADYIKAGVYGEFIGKLDKMRSYGPVLLHGMGYHERAGMKDLNDIDFNSINKYLADYGSPHLGLHLAIRNSDMESPMADDEIHRFMSSQIMVFKKKLNVPLLLENVPDTPEDRTVYDHYPFAEAEKLNKLITENDAYLLLDISHAKLTAEYRGWDVREYIKKLPLGRLKEIHVNGSGRDAEGNPTDPHVAMTDHDYELLEWTLEQKIPEIVTLEYNGVDGESSETVKNNLYIQLNKLNLIIKKFI